MWTTSAVSAVLGAAIVPAFGIYGPELFPTSLRGRANAIIQGLARVGSVIGLVVVGRLADRLGSYGPALALVALGPLALVVLIIVAFPETANQELEDLNPEDRALVPERPGRTGPGSTGIRPRPGSRWSSLAVAVTCLLLMGGGGLPGDPVEGQ